MGHWKKTADLSTIYHGKNSVLEWLEEFCKVNEFTTRAQECGGEVYHNVAKVIRTGMISYYSGRTYEQPPYIDHANYFKNPKTGLVCLTYNPYQSAKTLETSHPESPFDDRRKSVYEWAEENGLYAELYDYSWYFPGATCFVVISASPGSVIVPKPIYVQHSRTFICPDCGGKWYGEWYYFCPHCGREFSMEERKNHICGGENNNND